MHRIALPVCLLLGVLTLAPPAAVGAPDDAQPGRGTLSAQEKVALAWLGQIGAGDATQATRAKRLFATLPVSARLRPLAQALRCQPAALRVFAAEQLAATGAAEAARPLLWRVVREEKASVRKALVRALAALREPQAVHVLGRALASRYAPYRERAAEALAGLGDALAYPYLIRRWEGRSGDFPRVYFVQARQLSYIQDFDVEVAATSFIADPIVGVLQDATCLGVKVVATEQIEHVSETRALRGALESLSGERVGAKVGAWRAWWESRKDDLLAARARRYAETP